MPYDITKYEPGYGGLIDSSGNVKNIADGVTATGSQIVVTGGVDQATAYKSFTFQSGATSLGNGTFGDVTGYSALSVNVVISGSATITFELSNDNTFPASATIGALARPNASTGTASTTAIATSVFIISTAGFRYFRARISTYGSGTVDVTGVATTGIIPYYPTIGGQASSDLNTSPSNVQVAGSFLLGYNGVSWDRWRNNISGTALASAARTGTTVSSDLVNYNHRGIVLILNVTAASGTGGLQVALQYKDPISAAYRSIGTLPTAVTTAIMTSITFYPSVDAASVAGVYNQQSILLPQQFRVSVLHGDASSYTYSLSYQLIL